MRRQSSGGRKGVGGLVDAGVWDDGGEILVEEEEEEEDSEDIGFVFVGRRKNVGG